MVLCTHCGAEEMDMPLAIAVPVKKASPDKAKENAGWHWSQVSQKVCPVCGAQHVSITCSPKQRTE